MSWEPSSVGRIEIRACLTCARLVPHAHLHGWRTGRTWWEPAYHDGDGRPCRPDAPGLCPACSARPDGSPAGLDEIERHP